MLGADEIVSQTRRLGAGQFERLLCVRGEGAQRRKLLGRDVTPQQKAFYPGQKIHPGVAQFSKFSVQCPGAADARNRSLKGLLGSQPSLHLLLNLVTEVALEFLQHVTIPESGGLHLLPPSRHFCFEVEHIWDARCSTKSFSARLCLRCFAAPLRPNQKSGRRKWPAGRWPIESPRLPGPRIDQAAAGL